MKKLLILISLHSTLTFHAQTEDSIKNIIIVTIDGYRWEEVFKGMDSTLASDSRFNHGEDSYLFQKYWANNIEERRKKLMPFLWTTVFTQGQIYGNRAYHVKVNVSNKCWFSYPGYSEMFCGYADRNINSNTYGLNPNTNVLEFINKQDGFSGKVLAFGSWGAFDRILNEKRSNFSVVSGKDSCGGLHPDSVEIDINTRKRTLFNPFAFDTSEYLDVYTHDATMYALKKEKPRVLYIAYGETDIWAHCKQYDNYLNAAHKDDEWLSELWDTIQSDPFYKNKTLLFVTVDHGRGGNIKKGDWTDHNKHTKGSNHIWFAVMGPGIPPKGEVKKRTILFQEQFAQTWAEELYLHFTCEHKVAKGLKTMILNKR